MKIEGRSDQLRDLQELFGSTNNPFRPFLSKIISAKVIIDANVAYRALLWMAGKRKNPDAKPDIIEIAQTGFAELHAPQFIEEEVQLHLQEISEKSGKTLPKVEALWLEFRSNLHFHETRDLPTLEAESNDRDPKDAPYIQLQRHLKHPIVSLDKDIPAMGGETIDIVVIERLKNLYRVNATEYQIAITGYGVLFIGGHTVSGLINLVKQGISSLLNLPDWDYTLLLFAAVIVYKDQRLRQNFETLLNGLFMLVPDLIEEIMKQTDGAVTQFREVKSTGVAIAKQLPTNFQPNQKTK